MKTSLLVLLLLLTGCVTIKDYDSEALESAQIKNVSAAQKKLDPFNSPKTPDTVKVIEDDNVSVWVTKGVPLGGKNKIKLEVWHAIIFNDNNTSKCVSVTWKLQDFDFESPYPTEILVKAQDRLRIGRMTQTIWAFDGAFIALPPSGYASSINVSEPNLDKKGNQTCEIDESKIDEPGEERN